MCSLRHESDRLLAESIAKSLDRAGQQVTAFVPPGYERYVRVLNRIEDRTRLGGHVVRGRKSWWPGGEPVDAMG